MEYSAAHSLMETVRKINHLVQRGRSSEFSVDEYLRTVSQDPRTQWFTELLREKNEELWNERERWDRLAAALRAWHSSVMERESPAQDTDMQILAALRSIGIIEA